MKKEMLKHILTSVVAVAGLALLFVMSQSVIAQSNGYNSPNLLQLSGFNLEKFQLAPFNDQNYEATDINDPTVFQLLWNDLPSGVAFRNYGSSILNQTYVVKQAFFEHGEDGDTADLNIGFDTFTVPEIARLQVGGGQNGTVRVRSLADATDPNTYCVCADQFGAMRRCGIYDPANGQMCTGGVEPTFSCTGATPSNATMCAGDNTGLTANTPNSLVGSCTATKCEHTCSAGFTLQGGVCVATAFSCTGAAPSNASLCSGDNANLTANTPNTLVNACSPTKCEYTCDAGYTLQGGECVQDESYGWDIGDWGQCIGTSGSCSGTPTTSPNGTVYRKRCDMNNNGTWSDDTANGLCNEDTGEWQNTGVSCTPVTNNGLLPIPNGVNSPNGSVDGVNVLCYQAPSGASCNGSTVSSCTSVSGCSWNLGSSTETRTVVCRNSAGTVVADSFCSQPKPTTTQSCLGGSTPDIGCYPIRYDELLGQYGNAESFCSGRSTKTNCMYSNSYWWTSGQTGSLYPQFSAAPMDGYTTFAGHSYGDTSETLVSPGDLDLTGQSLPVITDGTLFGSAAISSSSCNENPGNCIEVLGPVCIWGAQ